MNEKTLVEKAKNLLTIRGGYAWSGARWIDVFGIFDVVYCAPSGLVSFYQITTKDHRWARSQKIIDFINRNGALPERSYLMMWDYRINDFIFECVN